MAAERAAPSTKVPIGGWDSGVLAPWLLNAKFLVAVLVANQGISGCHRGLALQTFQQLADSAHAYLGFESFPLRYRPHSANAIGWR